VNCFDCATHDRQAPAVAVCVDCGAAVCLAHAHVAPRWLICTAAINRTVRVDPPTRTVRCGLCQAARTAPPTAAATG